MAMQSLTIAAMAIMALAAVLDGINALSATLLTTL